MKNLLVKGGMYLIPCDSCSHQHRKIERRGGYSMLVARTHIHVPLQEQGVYYV